MTDVIEGVVAEPVIETPVEQDVIETPVEQEEKVETPEPQEKPEWQKKIDRQRAANSQLNKQLAEERARNAALQEQLQKFKVDTPEPKLDDYDTTEDYLEAKADFLAQKRVLEKQSQLAENTQKALQEREVQQKQQAFAMAEQQYVAKSPSYVEAKENVATILSALQPRQDVQEAIIAQADSENNLPQIIDYFGRNGGENLDQLERILSLSPYQAAVEIYKIQQQLKPAPQAQPLPKPLTPISGAPRAQKSEDKMTGQELLKKYNIKY